MEEAQGQYYSSTPQESALSHDGGGRSQLNGQGNCGTGIIGLKKRGHGTRSWIKIGQDGSTQTVTLDKATIMRHCSLPSRDLRLLDPMFIYPSTILGREKAIVVNLEQIRCIITADEVILMNSLDGSVGQYRSELCNRLQKEKADGLPFEFRALEMALELTCTSLDAQVRDEIEHLMDDDGDMAEMCLTEKRRSSDMYPLNDCLHILTSSSGKEISKSAPNSPERSISGIPMLPRAFSIIGNSGKHGSSMGSSDNGERIQPLEMLLEAYFIVIDNTLNSLSSLKEYIDDTEDFINIKLGNIQNRLIQFELLLTAATLVAAVFAAVTAVFGMNFETTVFDYPSGFHWVLVVTGITCASLYFSFLFYFKYKKVLPG
ncbi:magnesium transporter MRS2-5 isoform X2 [Arachis duranensis]|uniref:Magnesium transporter n=1 Tax=Arachis duranensis TaxID=130453 RepID=A0A9C6WU66_ARADU|nr:magnesium transporter MRS2-5 isoform X2 [Arachis hypogaea]XP_052118070.1 magnesium transporter MRS2-5 isoform X2 [Arachis duranensis]